MRPVEAVFEIEHESGPWGTARLECMAGELPIQRLISSGANVAVVKCLLDLGLLPKADSE